MWAYYGQGAGCSLWIGYLSGLPHLGEVTGGQQGFFYRGGFLYGNACLCMECVVGLCGGCLGGASGGSWLRRRQSCSDESRIC